MLGADYDTDVKPFLQGFDSVIGTTVPGDSIDNGTVIISVSGELTTQSPIATGPAHRARPTEEQHTPWPSVSA